MNNHPYKPIINWLHIGAFMVFLMVIVGGITRLTSSGLSMADWQLFAGAIPPLNDSAWQESFEKYQQTPEFQKINYRFDLEDFKTIFWWEYIHRLIGRLMGLVFMIPFLYFLTKGKISKSLMPKLLFILFLGALQAFAGWYMVKSGLVDRPFVSHYRLAFHLLLALLTFSYIVWTAQDEIHKHDNIVLRSMKEYRSLVIFLLCVVILQVTYGAFVAGLKAGYMYNTFPKMGDHWIAEAVWAFDPWWKNLVENRAGIQFIHRTLGFVLVFLAIYTFQKSRNAKLECIRQKYSDIISALIIIQFILGISTLLFRVPLWLGVFHQGTAFIVVLFNILLLHTFNANRCS